MRIIRLATLLAVLTAACAGGSSGSTTTAVVTTTAAATTTQAPTTTAATSTTAAAGAPLVQNDDGSYTIDWTALAGTIFYIPAQASSSDPFYHVHTDPAVDGFYFSIEAYTVYGTAWTGEVGEFTIDCTPQGSGICVHFDPDGPGPIGDLGADFMVTGDIEITEIDDDSFVAVLSNLTFSDGTTIPGPFTVYAG